MTDRGIHTHAHTRTHAHGYGTNILLFRHVSEIPLLSLQWLSSAMKEALREAAKPGVGVEVSSRGLGFLFLDLLQASDQARDQSVLPFRSEEQHYCRLSRARGQFTSDALEDAFTRSLRSQK